MEDIVAKLNALNDKINLVNQNVQFNITIMWTVITVIVATTGVALYSLAKIWVNKRVEQELDKKLCLIEKNLKQETLDYITQNQQYEWAKGTCGLTWTPDKDGEVTSQMLIYLAHNIEKHYILSIQLTCANGSSKCIILNYDLFVEKNTIKIEFKKPFHMPFNFVEYSVIYLNPNLIK